MNGKLFKVLGVISTVLGLATTLLSGWVENKNQKIAIAEEVAKQLSKQN